MKQLLKDFKRPLNEMETGWYRKLIVLVNAPVFLVIGGIVYGCLGFIDSCNDFWREAIVPSWKGEE